MDHKQLLNFLSICEEKSFSKAAKRCFITQQGLSKSIKQLESEFDVPLFVRTMQGIETTKFGKALQDAILPYMSRHDKIIDMMRRLKDKNDQCLSIGIINGYHKCLPPHFFSLFVNMNPDISIDIVSFYDELSQQSMPDYNIDIGFADAPIDGNMFASLLFSRSKTGLAVGKNHRFSKRGSIKPYELKDEQLIVLNHNRYLVDFCYRNSIKPRVRLDLAELDLVSELCASSQMACFLSHVTAKLAGLDLIDIEGSELYFETHLVANRNTHKGAATEKFIAYAREQLSDWTLPMAPQQTEQAAE
jgi:DNA-binding transcriptional LysR family regulator